ncbi:hypothetical protein HDE_07301 [Halotydeus destructor]|nr:hypothetical protein HDE_07301 [Halotydeus destructor]
MAFLPVLIALITVSGAFGNEVPEREGRLDNANGSIAFRFPGYAVPPMHGHAMPVRFPARPIDLTMPPVPSMVPVPGNGIVPHRPFVRFPPPKSAMNKFVGPLGPPLFSSQVPLKPTGRPNWNRIRTVPTRASRPVTTSTAASTTPRYIVTTAAPTSQAEVKIIPTEPPVANSVFPNYGFLIAGCNVYGKMYNIGETIPKMSNPCERCYCSPIGVQCDKLC